jgi:hypothetical protein
VEQSELAVLKIDRRHIQARIDELETGTEQPSSRRTMLRGLGTAAVGAVVGGLVVTRPAAADDGFGLVIGNDVQTATTPTSLTAVATWDSTDPTLARGILNVTNDSNFTDANAAVSCVAAYADNTKAGGHDIGVWATSKAGVGARLDGPIPLQLADASASGAPDQTIGTAGQFRVDNGDLWFCIANSGVTRWRKISGPFSAGAFHAVTPFRAYDSRAANPVGNVGPIAVGQNRLVSVKDARNDAGVIIQLSAVPLDAKSVAANITITGTVGTFGYLTINPGGDTLPRASTINWSASGLTIANGVTLALNASRELTVICGGAANNSTHFIIDITGYFL